MCPTIAEMGVRLWNWDFSRFGISQPFRSCEMRVTVLRNGTRVPKPASQLRNTLRNGTFGAKSSFTTSQCVSQLPNGCYCTAKWHSCAKFTFAAAKYPAKWSFPCEMEDFMLWWFAAAFAAAKWGPLCCEVALVCQIWFRSCENFRREGNWVANWFRNKISISQRLRNLADPCFSPVFAPFDFDFAPILLRFFFFNFFAIPLDFDHPKTYITSKQTELKHWNQN